MILCAKAMILAIYTVICYYSTDYLFRALEEFMIVSQYIHLSVVLFNIILAYTFIYVFNEIFELIEKKY